MIAQLTGRVDALSDGTASSMWGAWAIWCRRPRARVGAAATAGARQVLVETHVREDAIVLYGFAESASGIGSGC